MGDGDLINDDESVRLELKVEEMIRKGVLFFVSLCLLFLAGCPSKPPQPPSSKPSGEPPVFERIGLGGFPEPGDDEPVDTLRAAIAASLQWYSRIPPDRTFSFGSRSVSAGVLKESLAHFQELLDSGTLDINTIARDFDIFRVVPQERAGQMLVTGYYEPVLEGSLKPQGRFRFPLYGLPPDLISVDLERFNPDRFRGDRLIGRLEDRHLVPYYTRSEIDGQKKLEKSGVQIIWLADPVDCFFLHVQGSGVIRLPDGGIRRVGYAGANGRPYRSIGKSLIEMGAVPREKMSMQAIRGFLNSHPELRNEIMWGNESYVFFRFVSRGPIGSLDTVLTEGRSVATDPKFHPRGALSFLVSEKPVLDSSGQVVRWERLTRWVLNQDTGGAIKGPGRIDLFCGTGEGAEAIAGPMRQPGEMYYFIRKDLTPKDWQ